MMNDNNFNNGLRKLKVLDQKVDTLYSLHKNKEAFEKQKVLFHLLTSYSIILLNKNAELFQFCLSNSMKTYRSLLVQNYTPFDLKWKK